MGREGAGGVVEQLICSRKTAGQMVLRADTRHIDLLSSKARRVLEKQGGTNSYLEKKYHCASQLTRVGGGEGGKCGGGGEEGSSSSI